MASDVEVQLLKRSSWLIVLKLPFPQPRQLGSDLLPSVAGAALCVGSQKCAYLREAKFAHHKAMSPLDNSLPLNLAGEPFRSAHKDVK